MPNLWRRFASGARQALGFVGMNREEREMRDEMRFHLEMAARKHRAAGMQDDEARRAAALEFGGLGRWSEAARDEVRSRVIDDVIRDIRHAGRALRRAPAFAIAAVLSLAIGIGATSTIWTVVERVVLRPLPYGSRGQLVMLWTNYRSKPDDQGVSSFADYRDWTNDNPDVEAAAVFNIWAPVLTEGDRPEPLIGSRVSARFFDVLGVPPLLGRGFRTDEDVPNGPRVVVIAHSLWERRFHSDSAIVGKTIDMNALKYTVVGVMPPSFRDPEPLWKNGAEVWRPLGVDAAKEQRNWHYLRVIARLRPGVTLDRANRDLGVISARLALAYPVSNENRGAIAVPMQEQVVGEARPVLFAALGGAICLLLIVCGNVASLVLARHATRSGEIAVRTALGAARGRIVRMLAVEAGAIGALGAVLGLALAVVATGVLRGAAPPDLPRVNEIHVDLTVVAATMLVAVGATLLFGLAPSIRAARVDLASALQHAGNRAADTGRARRAIVVGELAFSVVLLVSAAMLAKSALALDSVPLGLVPDDLLMLRVNLPGIRYPSDSARRTFFATLDGRLRTAPGILAFATTSYVPLTGLNDTEILVGGAAERPSANGVGARLRSVSPGFFELLHIPVTGREFASADTHDSPHVAVINRAAADRFYPGENPIGRRLLIGTGADTNSVRIVGVEANVRFSGPASSPAPEIFQPNTQGSWDPDAIIVRGRDGAAGALTSAREAVRSVDPVVALSDVAMIRDIARGFSERQRSYATVFGLFAVSALFLSAIGVYGVVSYSVAQRRREIGIRLALGATAGDVARRVIGQAASLVLLGSVIGVSLGAVFQRFLRALFFQVAQTDPAVLAGSAALLAVIGLAASTIPGVRAGRSSPATTLRGN